MAREAEIQELIDKLGLLPHPEGGYYRETYRSDRIIDQETFPTLPGARNVSTAIYFLLTAGNFSAFHRIKSDEVWHFYSGNSINIHVIDPSGNYERRKLGLNFYEGEAPQLVVKAGDWFGSSVSNGGDFSLVGCTVAPGFDFNDFEMGDRYQLLKNYPVHSEIIKRLTRI